ncbi:helix-turn-helix transcriptional regulator [Bacillus niameyensis]|uniref:helix-turn-helix transcriptional regulator n=1 Tax=Bacillus niameyensis TaxID=1522308 RepID=UPI00078071A0|nr:AraC family transcriptional regulator [Bacillus niameyensis]
MNSEHDYESINFHFDNNYFNNPQLFNSIKLYQIGDISCKGGYVIGTHEQLCYELSYIVSGSGYFSINHTEFSVQEGDIVLNVPKQLHSCRADMEEPFRFYYFGFQFADGLDNDYSLAPIRKMFDQAVDPVVPNKIGIDAPFVRIFNELINLDRYSTYMMEMYLRQIVILAYRSFSDNWTATYTPSRKLNERKEIVYKVINYIDNHLFQLTDLTEIADELHYSYPHLSRIFAKEVGLTIKDYYNRKRFEKAVEWLKNGEMNVTQVAKQLQYHSIHTFSRAFRQHLGVSPTEYQTLLINAKKDQYDIKKCQRNIPNILLK